MKTITLALVLLMASCATTKKNISRTTSELHVVAVTDSDSAAVRHTDSVTVKKTGLATQLTTEDLSVETKTVEEEYKYIDTAMRLYKKRTTTTVKGKKRAVASLAAVTYDSTRSQLTETAAVKTHSAIDSVHTIKQVDRHIRRTSFPWWWIIIIAALVAAHLLAEEYWPAYKKIFKIFKN